MDTATWVGIAVGVLGLIVYLIGGFIKAPTREEVIQRQATRAAKDRERLAEQAAKSRQQQAKNAPAKPQQPRRCQPRPSWRARRLDASQRGRRGRQHLEEARDRVRQRHLRADAGASCHRAGRLKGGRPTTPDQDRSGAQIMQVVHQQLVVFGRHECTDRRSPASPAAKR